MADYKISYIGDSKVENVHHIGVDFNGNYYSVIFGRYVNGGFSAYQIGIVAVNLENLVIHFGIQNH